MLTGRTLPQARDGRSTAFSAFLPAGIGTLAMLGIPAAAMATPTGTYRLAFLSSDAYSGSPASTSIGDYNSFVNTEAGANSALTGITWTVIGSTSKTDAKDNVSCGTVCDDNVPIYLVDGSTEVASSTNALFAATTTTPILNAIREDQFGHSNTSIGAWTGSTAAGTAALGHELGTSQVEAGNATATDGTFLDAAALPYSPNSYGLYALSAPITPSVPEPDSGVALLLGGLAVTHVFRRRRASR